MKFARPTTLPELGGDFIEPDRLHVIDEVLVLAHGTVENLIISLRADELACATFELVSPGRRQPCVAYFSLADLRRLPLGSGREIRAAGSPAWLEATDSDVLRVSAAMGRPHDRSRVFLHLGIAA